MGGLKELSPAAAFDFWPQIWRLYLVNPNPAVAGSLPDARRLKTGGPILYALNVGSTNSFTIKDAGGTTLFTVLIGQAAELFLRDNTTLAGLWGAKIRTILS